MTNGSVDRTIEKELFCILFLRLPRLASKIWTCSSRIHCPSYFAEVSRIGKKTPSFFSNNHRHKIRSRASFQMEESRFARKGLRISLKNAGRFQMAFLTYLHKLFVQRNFLNSPAREYYLQYVKNIGDDPSARPKVQADTTKQVSFLVATRRTDVRASGASHRSDPS